jgi:DNA polymerase-3 subunit epsilon
MNFVAIDFETANGQRSSACALGIAIVKDGAIAERMSWLIRPPVLNFNHFNTAIHGLRATDVADKPTLAELWACVLPYIEGQVLVAHNAAFDISVLTSTLDVYEIPHPDFHYACTMAIAREIWPGLPTCNLKYLADFLGIQFEHHKADEDAAACAEIAIRACKDANLSSPADFDGPRARFPVDETRHCGGERTAEKTKRRKERNSIRATEIEPSVDFHPHSPFNGRTFVFTGELESMARKDAMQQVVDGGGSCLDNVSKHTDVLVVGGLYAQTFGNGHKTGKLKKAIDLIDEGARLEIIVEDDFLRMLNGSATGQP